MLARAGAFWPGLLEQMVALETFSLLTFHASLKSGDGIQLFSPENQISSGSWIPYALIRPIPRYEVTL